MCSMKGVVLLSALPYTVWQNVGHIGFGFPMIR